MSRNYGFAPYHFIDLNKNVLASDNQENSYDQYKEALNNGYIDVEIKAITELFTRGEKERFNAINKKPVFVGSSIRGSVRVLAEQMGYAEMEDIEKDEAFFYRTFDDKDGGQIYRSKMKPDLIKAGWLVFEDGMFKLYASVKFDKLLVDRSIIGSKPTDDRSVLFVTHHDIKKGHIRDKQLVYFKSFKPYREAGKDKPFPENYTVNIDPNPSLNKLKGVVVMSEYIRKKKKEAIIGVKSNKLVEKDEELLKVLRKIENDKNRTKVFSRMEIKKGPIPCFYILDENEQLAALGFNYFFRFPYNFNVGEAMYKNTNTQPAKKLDFASSIFGNEKPKNNSKVFFEDFYLTDQHSEEPEQLPHILAGPKASYYPHYLVQDEDAENCNTWDNKGVIAGYKNYWHKTEPGIWIKKEFKIDDKFDGKHPIFNTNFDKFRKNEYVNFLAEFTLNGEESKEDIEYFIDREKLTYKQTKIEEKKSTYYLLLKTEQHYNFFKKFKGIKYTLYYVNPPLAVLKEKPNYKYVDETVKKDKKGKETLGSKPIRVLPKGSELTGRIRFENLSNAELGLLLLSLDLPKGYAHKIGMGKPLGLGSARFSCKLNLINRKERYSAVFDQSTWQLGLTSSIASEELPLEKSIEFFKTCFIDHYQKENRVNWKGQERIQNLFIMLKTEGTDTPEWSAKTRYLELDGRNGNEFKNKSKLRKISEFSVNNNSKSTENATLFFEEKRPPVVAKVFDCETLEIGSELSGILVAPKMVEIHCKSGIQKVQLVLDKGNPSLDIAIGCEIEVLVKQYSTVKKQIIQVELNRKKN